MSEQMDEQMDDRGTDQELTPTLLAAGRRRADLHHALVEVEKAISGPAVGRETEWTEEVSAALADLLVAIDEHIDGSERPEGLYDEVLRLAPRLSNTVKRLQAEHPAMRQQTVDLIERLETMPVGSAWDLEDARDSIQRLLGVVVKHRQAGADLIWEAYNLDIGGLES